MERRRPGVERPHVYILSTKGGDREVDGGAIPGQILVDSNINIKIFARRCCHRDNRRGLPGLCPEMVDCTAR